MRIRLPRFLRRQPARPDEPTARTGTGRIQCGQCGESTPHPTGQPDDAALAWLTGHNCTPEQT